MEKILNCWLVTVVEWRDQRPSCRLFRLGSGGYDGNDTNGRIISIRVLDACILLVIF